MRVFNETSGEWEGGCSTRCDDGYTAPSEECDDGNLDFGDGCDCGKLEFGYACDITTNPRTCASMVERYTGCITLEEDTALHVFAEGGGSATAHYTFGESSISDNATSAAEAELPPNLLLLLRHIGRYLAMAKKRLQ